MLDPLCVCGGDDCDGVLPRCAGCACASGMSWASSAVDLTLRNTRRYGGYIVHMGMVLIFVGLAGAAFNQDVQKEMKLGSTLQIGRYNLLLQSFESQPEKNYTAERMIIEVSESNKPKMMLYPERRFFPTNEESGTMVAIYSTLRDDLYVVYSGQSPGQPDAGDSCVFESAGEVDLAGRRDCGDGDARRVAAESADGAGARWRSRSRLLRSCRDTGAVLAPSSYGHCVRGMIRRRRTASCGVGRCGSVVASRCSALQACRGARAGDSRDRGQANRRQVHVHVRLQSGADAVQSRRLHGVDRDAEGS